MDNDGDIDIVATPGPRNEILAYLNDGNGNFSPRTLLRNIGRNYNAKLWDFDQDGYLDMFIDGHEEPLKVFWGSRNGFSRQRSSEIDGFDEHLMQDMAFGQFASDLPQAAVLSSYRSDPSRKHYYQGYSIDLIEFESGGIRKSGNVDRAGQPKGTHWFPWFSACDLKDDGNLDLVYEQHGENWDPYLRPGSLNWSRIDKVLWMNDGKEFERVLVEDPIYFKDEYEEALLAFANEHGVTLEKYDPKNIHFRSPEGELVLAGKGFGDKHDALNWVRENYPLLLCETSTTYRHQQCPWAE